MDLLKVGESLSCAGSMPIPSQARKIREGVETGRAAPKGCEAKGEGTVQTTNAEAAAKVEVV